RKTRAPSCANSLAMARPMPRPEPVINATLFCRSMPRRYQPGRAVAKQRPKKRLRELRRTASPGVFLGVLGLATTSTSGVADTQLHLRRHSAICAALAKFRTAEYRPRKQ